MIKYKFYKKTIDTTDTTYFMVESDEESVIINFYFTINNYNIISTIIEKIENNRSLNKMQNPYVWGNEDVTVFANELGVLLVDKLAILAGQEKEALELTYEEFLKFLNDFKKFIEENS